MAETDLFGPLRADQRAIVCPFCGARESELLSLFGSQLLTAQYYCRACHTPFEQVKDAAVVADAARRDLAGFPRNTAAELPEEQR